MDQRLLSRTSVSGFLSASVQWATSGKDRDSAPVAQWLEQQTHNLLVRGSNPCGGTNQLARVLTLTSLRCWADRCSTSRWREDGVIWEVRDSRVMKSVPSAVADGSNDPLGSTR